jgi:hypothetical protein
MDGTRKAFRILVKELSNPLGRIRRNGRIILQGSRINKMYRIYMYCIEVDQTQTSRRHLLERKWTAEHNRRRDLSRWVTVNILRRLCSICTLHTCREQWDLCCIRETTYLREQRQGNLMNFRHILLSIYQWQIFRKNPFSLKHSTHENNLSLPANLFEQSDNETQSHVFMSME